MAKKVPVRPPSYLSVLSSSKEDRVDAFLEYAVPIGISTGIGWFMGPLGAESSQSDIPAFAGPHPIIFATGLFASVSTACFGYIFSTKRDVTKLLRCLLACGITYSASFALSSKSLRCVDK